MIVDSTDTFQSISPRGIGRALQRRQDFVPRAVVGELVVALELAASATARTPPAGPAMPHRPAAGRSPSTLLLILRDYEQLNARLQPKFGHKRLARRGVPHKAA